MKATRHTRLREIVEELTIETQEELAQALKERGFDVTQATVSRDIKEMMLIKIPTENGRYRYGFSKDSGPTLSQSKMTRLFQENVLHIGYSQNIIVIRTTDGGANYVAQPLDVARWPEILGTVAGDNTILIVVNPPEKTEEVVERLKKIKG